MLIITIGYSLYCYVYKQKSIERSIIEQKTNETRDDTYKTKDDTYETKYDIGETRDATDKNNKLDDVNMSSIQDVDEKEINQNKDN
jgi:hypothetical protein